jgi:hypothetical protein
MSYTLDPKPPTSEVEIDCRQQLLAAASATANDYELQMDPYTAWQTDQPERVQVVFLNIGTTNDSWCIGAIVRRNNGELHLWPREGIEGPIYGSTIIEPDQLETAIMDLVNQFTQD